jgi:NhaA family Na+:H+ antiporter
LFALFNAGVVIDFGNLVGALTHPITAGVAVGLIGGKFIGIVGSSWLAVRMGFASLPENVHLGHIAGAALLGAIGFTMSIFIAELAFANQPEMIQHAKLGILSASLLAGVAGYLVLHRLARHNTQESAGEG